MIMDVRIQTIHFDIAERLTDFINKKADKLARRFPVITNIDVTLKVIKPETANNKDVTVKVIVPQHPELVANKTADTFEEAYDNAIAALEHQLEKNKAK